MNGPRTSPACRQIRKNRQNRRRCLCDFSLDGFEIRNQALSKRRRASELSAHDFEFHNSIQMPCMVSSLFRVCFGPRNQALSTPSNASELSVQALVHNSSKTVCFKIEVEIVGIVGTVKSVKSVGAV